MASTPKKLGIVGLSAIVFGSIIGSGIFNIAQNMAVGSGAAATLISWGVTAIGMLGLVLVFMTLSTLRPDLNAGIYQYAQEGFGNYVGFNIAWGYWICAALGNVAYSIMFNDAWGVFFPCLLNHGWEAILFCSAMLWAMYALVYHGIHAASILNSIISFVKFSCLAMIVIILVIFFNAGVFNDNFWGDLYGLESLTEQVKNTMMVTLWCFIGIEGAVVMSARAKRSSYVAKASITGFLLAWVLYVLVSVLCFGLMSQPEMAGLENPSVAYVLKSACGEWAYYFVILSVITALAGGWVAWTLLCSQVPFEAAHVRIMPIQFSRLNRFNTPYYSLLVSTLVMQIFVVMLMFSDSVYLTTIQIAGMMVLPAYFFSGLFLWKASCNKEKYLHLAQGKSVLKYRILGVFCTFYCLWLMYAGGLNLLLCTSIFYLPGIYFYMMARRQSANYEVRNLWHLLTKKEMTIFVVLCVLGAISLAMLINVM